MHTKLLQIILLLLLSIVSTLASETVDPLPSWNEGKTKSAIIAYVNDVTNEQSPNYIPVSERIATFDNDGTLWSEQPVYFQVFFALYRIKVLSKDHPEWKTTEPFKSALADDIKGLMATGMKNVEKVLLTAHTNISSDEFHKAVSDWLAVAKHPQTKMPFTSMVYQPMLELLNYMRANGFKTFIVSGGGIDFMRVFSDKVYGIPPEQVIGTTSEAKFEMKNGVPVIMKTPKIMLVDDKAGKPVGIYQYIGRKPVFAAGNSDGDFQMLQYTTISKTGKKAAGRFALLIHHTDAKREWAYDKKSSIGHLEKALQAAPEYGWSVVDMKNDWKKIYPTQTK